MKIRNIEIVGLIIFGISIALSSCKAIQPVYTGPLAYNENADVPSEIIDPVCGQTIEVPQDELVWQYEGRNYYFYSNECMDQFKMTPEEYITVQPNLHQKDTANKVVTWSLWGAAAGAMMFLMLL